MRPKTVDVDTFKVDDPKAAFANFTNLARTVIHADPKAVDAAMKQEQSEREAGKRQKEGK